MLQHEERVDGAAAGRTCSCCQPTRPGDLQAQAGAAVLQGLRHALEPLQRRLENRCSCLLCFVGSMMPGQTWLWDHPDSVMKWTCLVQVVWANGYARIELHAGQARGPARTAWRLTGHTASDTREGQLGIICRFTQPCIVNETVGDVGVSVPAAFQAERHISERLQDTTVLGGRQGAMRACGRSIGQESLGKSLARDLNSQTQQVTGVALACLSKVVAGNATVPSLYARPGFV